MSVSSIPSEALSNEDIVVQKVNKRFGSTELALRDFDLRIRDKELLVLLGPSGCGKTTLLNILAGLEEPTSGDVYFGSQQVTRVPAEERDISMVFQTIGLYPHMNARENIVFPLKLRRVPANIINERAVEMANLLGIEKLLDRRINELSGGERQRVAIAKALVKRPRLFLLDEPFSSLDADLRRQLRSELVRIHRQLDITMVFVTHDQEEAMSMADRVALIRSGRLVQLGPPLDMYQQPINLWVARFIGSYPINVFEAEPALGAGGFRLNFADRRIAHLDPLSAERYRKVTFPEQMIVGIRPEHVQLSPGGHGIPAIVIIREVLGNNIVYHLQIGETQLRAVRPASEVYDIGVPVQVSFDWSRAFFFDCRTQERISQF